MVDNLYAVKLVTIKDKTNLDQPKSSSMNTNLLIWLSILAVLILYMMFSEYKKSKKTNELLDHLEKNRPNYNYFKILPHEVKPLGIDQSPDGRYKITFTPIRIEQMEEFIFIVGLKAKHTESDVALELLINAKVAKWIDEETNEKVEYNVLGLIMNTRQSDPLIKILANLFEVEISDKSQIVKSLKMSCKKEDFNIDNIKQPREFIAYFDNEKQSPIIPTLKIGLDIEAGAVYLEEIEPVLRPIIINRLLFKPNIKS